ncbi:MAG: ABC transporter ATP-binding protein [Clostridia bacterium]|nr:ABC transporter ATP-binding protein [Clostridia bacterium]
MGKIIKKHIKSLIVITIFLIVCNFLSSLHPYVMKQVLDIDFSKENIEKIILQFIIIYTLIHVLFAIFKNVKNILVNKAMARILKDIREKLFNKVLKFRMATFNKYNSAELYTRLTVDVDNLFTLFFGVLNIIVNNVFYIIFMIIMMYVANVKLALIGTVTIGVVAIIVYVHTKILSALQDEIHKKRDKENKEFSELYNKSKLTYLFKLQDKNIRKSNKLFKSELDTRKKYIFIHHFPYWILTVVQSIGIYAILHYALNIDTTISLGSIYLVLFYTKECKSPLEIIFNQLEEIQTCIISYKRIKVLLNENNDEIIENGEYIENLNGDIELQNVCMKYEKELILKNLSFIIKKGSKVTIAGRTGVGKTTLTNVLMKLYDIERGKILIGGYDISKISTKCLRDNISYISQTPYIFADTVRNNITLGNKDITGQDIYDLVYEIGVENLFDKLSEGLDTKIKISQLSYGELQIIAFIRAILHKANIYIFDEPTSNMDSKTERMIQNIIDKISEKSTVIIIAHRKSTIESSDKIIYLKDGQIDMIVNKELI